MEQRTCEQHTYEGLFMLDPTKVAQEWENIKKQIISMIEKRGGSIITAKKWGERKLAYEIKGHKRAVYLLVYFQMPSLNVNNLRRDLELSELVMRTLIVVRNKLTQEEQQRIAENDTNETNSEVQPTHTSTHTSTPTHQNPTTPTGNNPVTPN